MAGQVVIVGGGISGLSAAYELKKSNVAHTLIEKQPRLGGVIQTNSWNGCVLEGGPDSFLTAKPDGLNLIREIGLGDQVIGSNDSSRTTYILRRGKLVLLPEGVTMFIPTKVMPVLESPLFSWGTKIRMGLEIFRKPVNHPDRSVADFVVDHFGKETLDYLAEPLLSGVYGGDPAALSINSVLPRFAEMERKQGSLARAVIQSRKKAPPPGASGGAAFQTTLKGGLGQLVEALKPYANVRQGGVETIERAGEQWRVRVDGDWMDASHVILACPAYAAADVVKQADARLAELLNATPYSSSLTVALVYNEKEFDGRRSGFGFLVPSIERKRLLGCTFVASKFPNRAPADKIILRCFFGGMSDAAVLGESDESLVGQAREELKRILGLTAEPIFSSVARWPRAMAQYTVGHADRLKEIEARAAALPRFYLAGNAYTGIGIPDCIRMGRQAAKNCR